MWPKLYLCALLSACFLTSVPLYGQEAIPAPTPQVDPDAPDPFSDDSAEASNSEDEPSFPLAPDANQPWSFSTPNDQTPADSYQPAFTLIEPGTLDSLHSPLLRQDLQIKGAQSCATSNCHGGPRPGISQPWARRGSEYQIWVENDPHMQSWRTICSDESVAIMQRLNIMVGTEIVDQAGFDNCLACHNSTKRYNEPRRSHSELTFHQVSQHNGATLSPSDAAKQIYQLVSNRGHVRTTPADTNSFMREGVGCSGCHGPSEQWINTHFQAHWSSVGATHQGFVEAGDLYVRARMCASCHVGDKDRDMNHDIIAAGHPTLRYELATFHAWQPKHWRDAESNDKTFYEAQLWLAGQVASTDASLSLLHARSADAHTVSEWPEFAAYNCASCHHNLGLDNDRKPFDKDRKSVARYSQWHDSGLRWLIDYRVESGQATQSDHELIAALDAVEQSMETRSKPNPGAVGDAAMRARHSLANWFNGPGMAERSMFRSDRLGQVVASAAGKYRTFRTWESAVQFYLAAVAARESWPGGWHGPLRNIADRMQNGLRYPDMIDISRYSKRNGVAPELNRFETTQLGIELAGWLGPVHPEMVFDEERDDEEVTQELRDQLQSMIDKINLRWKQIAEQRAAEAEQANAKLKAEQVEAEKENPPPTPKTLEELKNELPGPDDSNSSDDET